MTFLGPQSLCNMKIFNFCTWNLVIALQLLLHLDKNQPYDIPTNFTKISYSKYAPKGIGSYESPVWVNVLRCSSLIYDPHKREQIWRFVTYMFLHADHWHLLWNTGIQLLVGEFHWCFSHSISKLEFRFEVSFFHINPCTISSPFWKLMLSNVLSSL